MIRARRALVALLALGASSPLALAQAPRPKRLGVLGMGSPADFLGGDREAFFSQLAALGFEAGRNLALEERYAANRLELDRAAADLVAARPDAIVTEGTPSTLLLQRATTTIPIVTTLGDPVVSGVVRDPGRPGGNVTGLSQGWLARARKQMELLRLLRPRSRRIGFFVRDLAGRTDSMRRDGERSSRPVFEAAREAGLEPIVVHFDSGNLASVAPRLREEHVDIGLIFVMEPRDVRAAFDAGIALAADDPRDLANGALFSLSAAANSTPRLAEVVARVLRGTPPGSIPFDDDTRFRLTISAKAAAQLGIPITQELRLRADEVIEQDLPPRRGPA